MFSTSFLATDTYVIVCFDNNVFCHWLSPIDTCALKYYSINCSRLLVFSYCKVFLTTPLFTTCMYICYNYTLTSVHTYIDVLKFIICYIVIHTCLYVLMYVYNLCTPHRLWLQPQISTDTLLCMYVYMQVHSNYCVVLLYMSSIGNELCSIKSLLCNILTEVRYPPT